MYEPETEIGTRLCQAQSPRQSEKNTLSPYYTEMLTATLYGRKQETSAFKQIGEEVVEGD